MKYIKKFEDFGPDHVNDVKLPFAICNELVKAWFNDGLDIEEKSKDTMCRFASDLYLSVLIGDDSVWGQEERTKRILDVMNDFNILPFDIKMPYNYMWMEAKKNGTEKLAKFWNNALKDPDVKKNLNDLTNVVKDIANKKKEQDDFKKVSKDLTQHFDLNSLKYNEAKIAIEDTTKTNFNVGSLIQIVDDNDKNISQAKIKKALKTLYHVTYKGENFKVNRQNLSINIHGQVQTELKNLIKI